MLLIYFNIKLSFFKKVSYIWSIFVHISLFFLLIISHCKYMYKFYSLPNKNKQACWSAIDAVFTFLTWAVWKKWSIVVLLRFLTLLLFFVCAFNKSLWHFFTCCCTIDFLHDILKCGFWNPFFTIWCFHFYFYLYLNLPCQMDKWSIQVLYFCRILSSRNSYTLKIHTSRVFYKI